MKENSYLILSATFKNVGVDRNIIVPEFNFIFEILKETSNKRSKVNDMRGPTCTKFRKHIAARWSTEID